MRACGPTVDILVIEDDPGIADFLVDLLRYEGYRVASLAEGATMEEVVASPPGLIFLDLMLPDPDGAEICRRLRAQEATRAVPIVIMTAASPAVRMQRLRGCAHDALLPKPFDVDDVLALAARYLRPATAQPATDEVGQRAEGE